MSHYDPRAKLAPHLETEISLARYGGEFLRHAASELSSGASRSGCPWETRYYLIRSALMRGDAVAVRIFVNDWANYRPADKPGTVVSKWIPGDHYHVLGEKFDTLDAARAHLEAKGYRYNGLRERFVYKDEN